jgi:hypothetical protein
LITLASTLVPIASGVSQLARREEPEVCLAEDQDRGDRDEDADDHRRKILDLVITVGQGGVRRPCRELHCRERNAGRHQVDDALERIRVERDRSGPPRRERLERKHDDRDGKAAERELRCADGWDDAHFSRIAAPACPGKSLYSRVILRSVPISAQPTGIVDAFWLRA